MRKRCGVCGGEMSLGTLDASGSDGPLKLTVRAMSAGKCARGHAVPAEDEFMLWLIRELKARAAELPAGTESGMVFKKYACVCGKELLRSHKAITGHTAQAVARVHDAAGFPHYG